MQQGLVLLFVLSLVGAGRPSLLCPAGQVPETLASASVWQKITTDNGTIFRIGTDELSNDGYSRSEYDRNLFVVLLGSGTSNNCPTTSCSLRLSTNQNPNDGNILHQENVFGAPFGFKEIAEADAPFCARVEGDCGTDVPIYRFANITGLITRYAYSIDPNASIPGYVREPTPICFGWSDGGSQKVASSLKVAGCKKLVVPDNGQVNYQPGDTEEYAMGSSATLTCNVGYVSTGPTELICSHTGWYPTETFELCQPESAIHPIQRTESRCASISSPLFGTIEYSKNGTDTYPTGTIAKLKCNTGYTNDNPTVQAECDISGRWTVENLGRCVQLCKALPNIPNGQLNYTNEPVEDQQYIDGTVVSLQCLSGYSVNGLQSVTCQNAQWTPFPGIGSCIPANDRCLFGFPMVLGGSIVYSNGALFGPFAAGTEANLTCSPGLQVQGNNASVCRNSTWEPSVLGVCLPVGVTLPTIQQTTTTTTTTTTSATNIGAEGVVPGGELNKARGVGNVEAITPVQIPPVSVDSLNGRCANGIPNPSDGIVIYSHEEANGPYAAGTIATLKCNNGYIAHGETSICHDGQWYPPTFSPCTKDGPPPGVAADELPECLTGIPVPLNGRILYSNGQTVGPFPVGTIATVNCNIGYFPVGTTALSCQNGIWSPGTPAQCVLTTGARLSSGGVTTGSCLAGLGLPLNGRVDYSNLMTVGPFPAGTAGTLVCNAGYEPSGITTSICQNGLWSPSTLGECVLGATGGLGPGSVGTNSCAVGLTAPLNGVISYSSGILPPYPAGTTATVICHLGYTVSGTPTSTCTNGVWYPTVTAQCTTGTGEGTVGGVGSCSAIAGPLNGEIMYIPLSLTTTYNSGTTATLACNLGYIASGQISTTCMNGVWEPAFTGTCVPGLGNSGGSTAQCLFALPAVLNGNIQYSTGSSIGPYNEGTSATLTCSAGYLASGSVISLCSNGVWNPTALGTCVLSDEALDTAAEQHCPQIHSVDEGQIYYSGEAKNGYYRSGTLAGLQCYTNDPINGAFTICINGQWIPALGTCKPDIPMRSLSTNCAMCLMAKVTLLLLYTEMLGKFFSLLFSIVLQHP